MKRLISLLLIAFSLSAVAQQPNTTATRFTNGLLPPAKATAPFLGQGSLWFDTVSNTMKYYNGTSWVLFGGTFTELDPTVPNYSKTLTAFSVIKSNTDPLYQSTLASGTNIKTLNGQSLLGSGNITITSEGGGIVTEEDPTVPAYGKSLTSFGVIKTSTDGLYSLLNHGHTFGSITAKPTSLGGYGITDAYPLTGNPSGFLTSFTETDPTVGSHIKSITTTEKNNWNTAYSWSNHAGRYPTYDGTGATGLWNINVSGNSNTTTRLVTARAINGVAFDGSDNITIPIGITTETDPTVPAYGKSLTSFGVIKSSTDALYPTLTGGNASGTWGINISGSAVNAGVLEVNPPGLQAASFGNYAGITQDATEGPGGVEWTNRIKILHANSGGNFTELAQRFTGEEGLWHRRMEGGDLSTWKRVLDDSNYNLYSPTLTGIGASGLWGINIGGNAASSTLWNGNAYDGGEIGAIPAYIMAYSVSTGKWQPSSPTNVRGFLGLGSNAYSSTAFYPASNPNGYISGYTETDPTVPLYVKNIQGAYIASWNNANSWGNHAAVNYATRAGGNTFTGLQTFNGDESHNGIETHNGGNTFASTTTFNGAVAFNSVPTLFAETPKIVFSAPGSTGVTLRTQTFPNGNYEAILPNKTGIVAMLSDIPTLPTVISGSISTASDVIQPGLALSFTVSVGGVAIADPTFIGYDADQFLPGGVGLIVTISATGTNVITIMMHNISTNAINTPTVFKYKVFK